MNFSARFAQAHIRLLAETVGIRAGGSAAERRAGGLIARYFRSLGLATRVQPFRVQTPGSPFSEVRVEGLGVIPSRPVAATASTPAAGISGNLVFVETGEDVHLPAVPGKILLVYGELGTPEKYEALMRARPAAIVLAENIRFIEPRLTKLSNERFDAFGAVPTVRIRFEDAARLLRAGKTRIRIRTRVSHAWAASHNIIAELPGTDPDAAIVVVGGHYDSVWGGYGAQDNAAGAAVVMELARIFARRTSRRTVRFVTFGSEELGLRGSTAYVEALKEAHGAEAPRRRPPAWKLRPTELERHRLMLNVDLQGLLLGENYCPIGGPPELSSACRLLSSERGPAFRFDDDCYSSDNAPFAHAGIPTAAFGRLGVELMWAHTPADTLDRCHEESLQPIGEYLETFLSRWVIDAKAFPFPRVIPEEHRKKVEAYFRGRMFGYVESPAGGNGTGPASSRTSRSRRSPSAARRGASGR
ncbi:MAG: M20/M25/M40 family metallo-hydrolase [Candidatus Brocadiae bacterium]|nr:M20/M25/M40 family metallo-hydrolase [Candidatus Brocadiia bacterium]